MMLNWAAVVIRLYLSHFTNEEHVFQILNFKLYLFKKIPNSLRVQKFKVQKVKQSVNVFPMPLSGYSLSYQKQPVLPVSCVSFQIVHISTNAKYSLQIVDYCLGYFFFLVHFGDHFLVIS